MVQSSLVGWWPLHEWDGRANDLSGNGNHGTLVNGPTQGVYGTNALTSYKFSNNDSTRIEIGDIALDSSGQIDFSASLWFKTTTAESQYLLSTGGDNGWYIRTHAGGGDEYGVGAILGKFDDGTNELIIGGGKYNDDEWHNATIVNRNSTLFVYVDGELLESQSHNVGAMNDSETTISGNYSYANTTHFADAEVDGNISDVRIYNRALSQSEIEYLYQSGTADVATPPGGSDSGAVSRYAFDDPSDTGTAIDSWGSNDGTINGAVYSNNSIRGLAMEFSGNSNRVVVNSSDTPNIGDIGTMSVWTNPNDTSTRQFTFFHYDGSTRCYLDLNSGEVRAGLADNAAMNTGITYEPQWNHLTMVWNSGNYSVYKNGSKLHTGTYSGTVGTDGNWYIGNDADDGENLGNTIDDVRIYDRALSNREVQQLYQWGTRGVDMRSKLTQH
jgi:hypothetical protein